MQACRRCKLGDLIPDKPMTPEEAAIEVLVSTPITGKSTDECARAVNNDKTTKAGDVFEVTRRGEPFKKVETQQTHIDFQGKDKPVAVKKGEK